MPELKTIFQTLEDRGKPDDVELHGPFPCRWKNTWLGEGYYFWDTFMSNAHFWGHTRYGDTYIICEAKCVFDTERCLDLVGCTEHLVFFAEIVKQLEAKKLLREKTTVATVIEFMKSRMKSFVYEAIRVYGINSISSSKYPQFANRIKFEEDEHKNQYLDISPAIQICIFKKNGLGIRDYRIIYPVGYVAEDYVI